MSALSLLPVLLSQALPFLTPLRLRLISTSVLPTIFLSHPLQTLLVSTRFTWPITSSLSLLVLTFQASAASWSHFPLTSGLTGITGLLQNLSKAARKCSRKRPITRAELSSISRAYSSSTSFDDTLFLSILLTGFHGLLRLGELTWQDKRELQDYRKVIMRNTVCVNDKSFQFLLPGHKADRFFEGNLVVIQSTEVDDDAWSPFRKYLGLRDQLFPHRAELWLKSDGTIPTRSWFLHRLHKHFPGNVGGQSLRAGDATALAEAGIPASMIQAIGRWSSVTFQIYIRHHPVLLAALLCRSHSVLLC